MSGEATPVHPRQAHILSAVVRHYLPSGEPVGSQQVARMIREQVSTATIRHEMMELEQLGYLTQPHTSAGRVPTDLGFRFYVDQVMRRSAPPSPREQASIRSQYVQVSQLEPGLRVTCQVLSRLTGCASMAVGPDQEQELVTYLELTRVDRRRLLFALVVSSGRVTSSLHRVRQAPAAWYLARLSRALTQRFGGQPVHQMGRGELAEVARGLPALRDESVLLDVLEEGLRASQQPRLYLGGTANIVSEGELQPPQRLCQLMHFLEDEVHLRDFLERVEARPLAVVIGSEAGHPSLQECAIVVGSYASAQQAMGKVGIVGPKRIPYGRALAVVGFVARTLGETLSRVAVS